MVDTVLIDFPGALDAWRIRETYEKHEGKKKSDRFPLMAAARKFAADHADWTTEKLQQACC